MNRTFKLLVSFFIFSAVFFHAEKVLAQMEFVQNKGQWDKNISYKSDFSTGSFFLENKGFTVLMHNADELLKMYESRHTLPLNNNNSKSKDDENILHSFSYNVTFLGANSTINQVADNPSTTYNNYFIGKDESQWASNCKIYKAVTYKNVYPNIDIRYYGEGERLKYDFIIKPGGNPNAIAMRYDGGVKLSVKNKELIIGTSIGDVKELKPYTYQTSEKQKSVEVTAEYVIKDNVVTFKVGDYDRTGNLVIDPQLVFATFTGSAADNYGYTATPGPDGTFYAGGVVFGNGYKVSPGAYQTTFAGGKVDIGIFKFSANGDNRIYATYIGGNNDEQPHSMIVDAAGNLIIAGKSNSSNYPLKTSIPSTGVGYDIVVTKLNSTGTAILGSVKIGGSGDDGVNIREKTGDASGTTRLRRNYGDDARSEVILDASNNIFLASCTQSSNFPVTPAAIQSNFGGAQDGVIIKFNSNLSSVLFSTYFGGSGDDACFVAAINPTNQNLYIGGATSSTSLPGNTSNTIGSSSQGDIDGFVTIIQPNGTSAIKTTYLGTAGIDLVFGLKFDKFGFPYVMGTTTGNWFITSNIGFENPGSKQFIAKLKPDLSSYVYSTVFGGASTAPKISPVAFLVDRCENVYVSGWGGGLNTSSNYINGNTNGVPEVNPLANIQDADGQDFYFFVLKKDAQSQLFGSHFGQFGGLGDHVDGGTSRFDVNGVIYQAVCGNCFGRSTNPATPFTTGGSWSPVNGSVNCNQAAVKIDMNFSGVGAEVQSSINGEVGDTLGCVSLTVNFKDLQKKGVTYYWNFNSAVNPNAVDTITTTPEAIKTFSLVGTYRVRLIAEDLNTCNLRDTSYVTIIAGDNVITPRFTKIKLNPCDSSTYEFTNLSSSSQGSSFTAQSFVWDYGDGSPLDTAGLTPKRLHRFPGPGTYFVKLSVIDTRFCNAPVTIIDTLRINPLVVALPDKIILGCVGDSIKFKNRSLAGLSWYWNFGDPASGALNESTEFEPSHVYKAPGSYEYYLIAYDSTTCNKIDTSEIYTIKVVEKPIALFTWAPNPPEANVPVRFTNLSSFADTYLWEFGDGETSTAFAPVHEYNSTGTFQAKLTATSKAGCFATYALPVSVIINPLLDVPNAFTPGRFGVNSVVNVRGFGIGKMNWTIYNRWGQIVFQSNSKRQGWDGFYKGKLQPIDTYGYTLDVEFTDGKKMRKTGDITLLR